MIDMDVIRALVRKQLEEKHMTLQDLADASDVPKSTIDNFLQGKTLSPSFDRTVSIFSALDIPFSAIENGESDPLTAQDGQEGDGVPASVYIRDMKAVHQRELAALEKAHRAEVDALKAHMQGIRRTRMVCGFVALGLLLIVLAYFVIDITNAQWGMFQ